MSHESQYWHLNCAYRDCQSKDTSLTQSLYYQHNIKLVENFNLRRWIELDLGEKENFEQNTTFSKIRENQGHKTLIKIPQELLKLVEMNIITTVLLGHALAYHCTKKLCDTCNQVVSKKGFGQNKIISN